MEEKYQIVNKLLAGDAATDIAKETGIGYAKVLRIKREFEEAQANEALGSFIDMDAVMMDKLLESAKETIPAELIEAAGEAVGNIKEAKSAMDLLSNDMIVTATTLTTRIKSMSLSIEHVSELGDLAKALCDIQNAFFNSNKTQVNIQNNMGSTDGYGEFLSDQPKNI